ncbi:MAG: flagellin lysine-N-methylase [Myxococcota bacterium]|nr:flagellin lysine-N-methylase [Myxococcota bacterium]
MGSFTWRYMNRFQCIGGDCEDTCCAAWGVEVSRTDVAAIHGWLADEPGRFEEAILTYPPKHRSPGRFGRIRMSPGCNCPLLSTDGLCGVHANLGEAALPMTCTSYPRSLGIRGEVEVRELSGFLSCPEVVRQLLADEDALTREPGVGEHRMNLDQSIGRPGPYFERLDAVRTFVAAIGEGRPLADQLWLQFRFSASSVARFNRAATAAGPIEALMAQFSEESHLDAVLAERPGRLDAFDAVFLAQVAKMATTEGQYRKPQALLLETFLQHGSTDDLDAVLAGHRAASASWQAPPELSRYVAHHWLTRWYTNGPDLSYHAEWLLMKMAILRLLLVSGADLVAAIYSTDRIVEHHGWIYECKGELRKLKLGSFELAGALLGF